MSYYKCSHVTSSKDLLNDPFGVTDNESSDELLECLFRVSSAESNANMKFSC